jgi:hypothetical protein
VLDGTRRLLPARDTRIAAVEDRLRYAFRAPLRLLDGDLPHRDGMRQIAEWNVAHTLRCLADFES